MSGMAIGYLQAANAAAQPASASMATGDTLFDLGTALGLAGGVSSAIGSWMGADAAKFGAKFQASQMEFQRSQSNINARLAEQDAQALLDASKRESGQMSAAYGQAREQQRIAQAGAGITGEGSAAEVQASIEGARQEDAAQIDRNAIRAAAARRLEAVNSRTAGRMAAAGAANLRSTARSISPEAAAFNSVLESATVVAPRWVYRGRRRYD